MRPRSISGSAWTQVRSEHLLGERERPAEAGTHGGNPVAAIGRRRARGPVWLGEEIRSPDLLRRHGCRRAWPAWDDPLILISR